MITREKYLLDSLSSADGPSFEQLLATIITKFPCGKGQAEFARIRAARVIQDAVRDKYVTSLSDGTFWLTAKGWGLVMSGRRVEAAAAGQRRGQ